ncbi:MAG: flagellar basal body protein [Actinobacteria bacterium]|nr:flagellar basal body protein [Actinomycetota bacterium]
MSIFNALSISGSGMQAAQTWIDAIGGNVANMNDAVPANKATYRAQYPIAQPLASSSSSGLGEGVVVTSVALGPSKGELSYDPTSPVADAQGMVAYPAIDLGQQLVDLVTAQNSYQANAAVATQAEAAYKSALTLGT